MWRYFASLLGRKNVRSFQLRMRGISLIPSRNERAWTGVDCPWVSACTVVESMHDRCVARGADEPQRVGQSEERAAMTAIEPPHQRVVVVALVRRDRFAVGQELPNVA